MLRTKRLRSVCHSIAHHAASGLSDVHPHLLAACRSAGTDHLVVDLLSDEPCPPRFREIEPLRLSLRSLEWRFADILASEGFTYGDLLAATLTFVRDPAGRDDYSSICRATLRRRSGEEVEYIVNSLGQRLRSLPDDPPARAPA